MFFCSCCGHRIELKTPIGDNRERHICMDCGEIHYLNPKNIVGTIPTWDNKILLCRRAIEPRYGYWTLPAGFMEINETVEQAGIRETIEEAGARVELLGLFSLINVLQVQQVHFFYHARLLDTNFEAGTESLEVALFDENDIPWENIAFSSVRQTLELFFEDREKGSFGFHTGTIESKSW